ncbi:hypothetical protein KCP74_04960 [Salmonella enterica subsp. enterica]|nr:hypothetical protein KCP74_04960 [Salmonella enterica subsp. enterica]
MSGDISLQPAGIKLLLKSVDNTLLVDSDGGGPEWGIAALPHWVVESAERRGLR